jgi:hypothetical protein
MVNIPPTEAQEVLLDNVRTQPAPTAAQEHEDEQF